ncbi:MAG: nucleoside deaminase [Dehalococcoidia bacterium]|nr:nucleoside deaminase [Dehalococcoidia bacterium]
MREDDARHLERCIELARAARDRGDRPFGSLLVGRDGQVLKEAMNCEVTERDVTGHPELELARWASRNLSPAERAAATMYTSCEHCAMCATAHYWAGIGRLVFALSGIQLRSMLPAGAPVLTLDTRDVFARGNLDVTVEGPFPELETPARAVHQGYW